MTNLWHLYKGRCASGSSYENSDFRSWISSSKIVERILRSRGSKTLDFTACLMF
ncbi:hypothetical protein BDA96_10G263600 [Sorghum bicolor]|uniref:Uncharacterized protein n=2 Tax=Sorghum bicolor TaxID=4558 RepID=A0A921Q4A6_SORBI|nr:hypothetical protein BDA96_10G263600 [Sorghum bicolor]OQU76758.1 hypothetical protein SORBI_3010G202450 [Sorghum bicolor]